MHASNWDERIEHAALSDIGMRRQNNQDSLSVMAAADEKAWRKRGHLFMVADGMGAHAAGELASKLACDGIPHNYSKMLELEPPAALQQAISGANVEIHGRGQAEAGFHGMGTTCSTLVLLPEGAIVGHVGDSRVYRIRNQRLEQLTFDHSLVWEMCAAGQADAAGLPKNIITRSLGPNPQVQVDLEGPFAVRPGDTFVVCSDGLTGPVHDAEIGAIVATLPPDEAARTLVDLANLRGGPDNISVIVVRVASPPVATETEPEEVTPRRIWFLQPAAWGVALVALAAAAGLFYLGKLVSAAMAGLGATVALVVALLQRGEPAALSDGNPGRAPLGRGPYVSIDCAPTQELIDDLAGMGVQLREAATQQGWQVDWARFEQLRDESAQTSAAGDLAAALRGQCHSITLVVDELRRRRGELAKSSDSDVRLL